MFVGRTARVDVEKRENGERDDDGTSCVAGKQKQVSSAASGSIAHSCALIVIQLCARES